MTWEETILFIRSKPEYAELVEKSYLSENIRQNIEEYGKSEEFKEIIRIFNTYNVKRESNILEIGAGNGIASANFALNKFNVTCVEPDSSLTVGTGALDIAKKEFKINLQIVNAFGENLPFVNDQFDIVFVRQALHHANDLNRLLAEASRVLKRGGLFLAVREHVIFGTKDKAWFLENHPLQKFYGSENAFTLKEYCTAIENAGLKLNKIFRFFENIINFYPFSILDFNRMKHERKELIQSVLKNKLGSLSDVGFFKFLYGLYLNYRIGGAVNERNVPGRMYTFIAIKP